MKAILCTKYGPPEVLKLHDIDKPIPKENEILVKIYATSVHIGDTKIRRCQPGMGFFLDLLIKPMMRIMLGLSAPRQKILGMELAGKIEQVGQNVDLFKANEKIFASSEAKFGCYAEYICLPQDSLIARLPKNVSYEEAASVPNGAMTALLFLNKGNIRKHQKVLIYGASGSVGTFAVQLAKNFGANVTGVCSTVNLDMVKSLGADEVIDYTQQDFSNDNKMYDIIFDAVGKLKSSQYKSKLNKGGRYLNVLSPAGLKLEVADLLYLKQLMENNKLKAVIEKTYPLEQIVEAHHHVDKGHKKGNVVIVVSPDDEKMN